MKWLRFIAAKSYEERVAIAEGDEMFVEFNEWIDNYVNDDITKEALAKWNKEIEENKHVKIAREQGMEQKAIEIAKRMLESNVTIQDIAKYTGLSEEDIKEFSVLD